MSLVDPIIVRRACLDDLESIIAYSSALALETEGRELDQTILREGTSGVFADPARGFFLVAEHRQGDRRRLIGQLMITYEWSDWRNGLFWWIQSVYVDPEWRRQGVYRTLHNHIMAEADIDPKICGVRLYVERDNQQAKIAYRQVGLGPSSYEMYEKDFVLVKRRVPL
jgi:GNAT superfamily N-acetyltransferase